VKTNQKNSLIFGLFLIVIGALFITYQFIPGLKTTLRDIVTWPMIIIALGAYLVIKHLVEQDNQGIVSGCVILGIGGLLYWQNLTHTWDAWYNWLLVPGFVGVGHLLTSLAGNRSGRPLERGLWLIGLSAVLYAIFSPLLKVNWMAQQYWPILLIAAGLFLIVKAVRRN
jgi:hypothetical protein